jgi:hypothetical protein
MKYAVVAFTLAALQASLATSAAASFASNPEHCPGPGAIRETGGVYTSRTQDGSGEWLGIAPAGTFGKVKSFVEAKVYDDKSPDVPPKKGDKPKGPVQFGQCSYHAESGIVDLRYKPQADPVRVILTSPGEWVSTTAWEPELGPFGLQTWVCRAAQATACMFVEHREP